MFCATRARAWNQIRSGVKRLFAEHDQHVILQHVMHNASLLKHVFDNHKRSTDKIMHGILRAGYLDYIKEHGRDVNNSYTVGFEYSIGLAEPTLVD